MFSRVYPEVGGVEYQWSKFGSFGKFLRTKGLVHTRTTSAIGHAKKRILFWNSFCPFSVTYDLNFFSSRAFNKLPLPVEEAVKEGWKQNGYCDGNRILLIFSYFILFYHTPLFSLDYWTKLLSIAKLFMQQIATTFSCTIRHQCFFENCRFLKHFRKCCSFQWYEH